MNGHRPFAGQLLLPNVAGLTLLEAALAYAEAGWYLLPTHPADIKNPGSVVGGKWHQLSSCDPKQIRRWWTANPNCGIALHCGRSGAGVFDYDMNNLNALRVMGRGDIADALMNATAVQGTRRDGDRGHYIFLLPDDGMVYGNGAGAFTVVGEFRGKNGVIIAAPTPHPDAASKGGHYNQRKTGPVGPMPDVLQECLSEAGASADPLTDVEMEAFLDTHRGGGCGRDGCRHAVSGPVKQLRARIANGEGRHDSLVKVAPWAFAESMAGCYPARELFGALYSAYAEQFSAHDEPARVRQLGDEYLRIVRWAMAVAEAEPDRAHRNDELPTDAELDSFWSSCPELRDMRQFARARRVGPWAMFGVCAAITISAVPPYVVLPPLVGRVASLNTFVALVGKSGSIKSAAIGAAFDWLSVDPPPNPKKPGSGEGLAKCFAYVKKPKGEPAVQVGKNWSVLAEIPEVDTLTATGSRGGSTLMSELRYAWSGERLGIDYAADDKAITLHAQRYRLCMIVGVQPLRAAPIFDDADAGTPQRFVWFPVSDPDRPKDRPAKSPRLDLPAWPGLLADNALDDDGEGEGHLRFGRAVQLAGRMSEPADPDEFEVLAVPDAVYTAIDEQAFAVLGDDANIDPLDGHKLLCREKLAAAIAILRQHKDITEHDWDLAGIAMKVSDRTRGEVLTQLAAEAAVRNRKAGQAAGVRKVAEAERIADEHAKKLARIAERITEKLQSKNDQTLNEIKKQFGADKHYVDEALDDLEDDGQITKQPFEYKGRPGIRLHLNDEDNA
ncbi:bifunctional DNA primase/polymerase [Mycobacterium intracellulare subsp. intracellulare]|nr:bifunctional DNA primase/polymerase [Mycobacterium intracellulare]UGU05758.1 bifunctional DNA primase/polymerase [Mycobacterium intracellulare subsp. intracellulare]